MRIQIIKCDICGKEGAKASPFYVGRKMGAAGSMDDEYESLDLCENHAWKAYMIAETIHGQALGARVYSLLKSSVKT